jgi:hypothetical protein
MTKRTRTSKTHTHTHTLCSPPHRTPQSPHTLSLTLSPTNQPLPPPPPHTPNTKKQKHRRVTSSPSPPPPSASMTTGPTARFRTWRSAPTLSPSSRCVLLLLLRGFFSFILVFAISLAIYSFLHLLVFFLVYVFVLLAVSPDIIAFLQVRAFSMYNPQT